VNGTRLGDKGDDPHGVLLPVRYPTAPAAACDINEQWFFLMQLRFLVLRVFRRDFFASDKADHAAILEYASGNWWSRR
jgi:hypothetical protein